MSAPDYAHAFILRVWREPREIPGAPPLWRGSVELVGSGAQRYLNGLEDLTEFILAHTGPWSPGTGRAQR
jgi:hypothetical protein